MPIKPESKRSSITTLSTISLRSIFLIFISLFFLAKANSAEKVVFYLEDEPIYTSQNQDRPGFLMEVVNHMIKHLDIEPSIEFLPWLRAQSMAEKNTNAVIFPLSRTASREDKYKWLCKVYEVPVAFITKDGNQRINSVAQAIGVRGLGVIRGTPQEEFLSRHNIDHVSIEGKELYVRLEKDMFSAVYSGIPEAVSAWNSQGLKGSLRFGKTLQTLPLWIAASKDSIQLNADDWESALQKVKDSGQFNALVEKYFGPGLESN